MEHGEASQLNRRKLNGQTVILSQLTLAAMRVNQKKKCKEFYSIFSH